MEIKPRFAPNGKVMWARVFDPQDPIEAGNSREWGITLLLDPKEGRTLDFVSSLEDLFKELNGDAKVARDGWPFKEHTDKDGKPDGMIAFRFKRKETSKKGNILPPPTVIDSKLNPWPAGTLIGNGSICKIKFSFYAWPAVTGAGRGLSLWLEAVQVLDLVPYEQADPIEGFGEEEGYVATPSTVGFSREAEPAAPLSMAEQMRRRAAEVEDEKAQIQDDDIPF